MSEDVWLGLAEFGVAGPWLGPCNTLRGACLAFSITLAESDGELAEEFGGEGAVISVELDTLTETEPR
jgi:hypothetical protein